MGLTRNVSPVTAGTSQGPFLGAGDPQVGTEAGAAARGGLSKPLPFQCTSRLGARDPLGPPQKKETLFQVSGLLTVCFSCLCQFPQPVTLFTLFQSCSQDLAARMRDSHVALAPLPHPPAQLGIHLPPTAGPAAQRPDQ